MEISISRSTRAWIYRVGLAVAALAGLYGLAEDQEIAGWVALLTALVGNGLATINTER